MSNTTPSTDEENIGVGSQPILNVEVTSKVDPPEHLFEEFETVRLGVAVWQDEVLYPEKTPGTIVHVYEKALAYEVEVSVPKPAVITREEKELEKLTATDTVALLSRMRSEQQW